MQTASVLPGIGTQLLNDRSQQIIGADLLSAPGFVTPAGLTGRGQVVAVADSGIDKGSMEDIHPDLASQPGQKPKIIMLKSWAGRLIADDPVGHGTHMAGTIAGSALQYTLSRHLLKPRIDRFLASRPALVAIQSAVLGEEFRLQLLIRLTPINRALTGYMLGAAGVGFPRFIAASFAALPYLCIEVYAGYAGRHLMKASGQPQDALSRHDLPMLLTMGLAITAMVLIARIARRAIEAATVSSSAAGLLMQVEAGREPRSH